MTETRFDKSLSKLDLMLRCSGTNISIGNAAPTNTRKNRFIYILNFILLNTDVIGSVCWFISGLKRGESFINLTYVAPCITLGSLCNMKSIFNIINEKKVYQLMEILRSMEIKERTREQTERVKIIEKGVNFLNLVVNALYSLNILLLICFGLHPLLLIALNYMQTRELELQLPFLVVYPFDAYNIKLWPFVYIRQMWSGTVAVLNICVADFVFYNICSYITIQFRLLQYDIENIITETGNTTFKDETHDRTVRNKLVEIIKRHQEIITCVNLLENIYSISTLYNFISSSIIICLTGFNVTENTDIILVISFLMFLFMGLTQIFFLCFFGDMLMDASVEVSNAVYNSKWYLASARIRKSLLLIQTRAQSPCKLTAFDFGEVSLKAFMKVLSTSWSYFALLKTLYSSE